MKKVYPVHYKRSDVDESDTYFIVATNSQQAEEIAFSCIANNPPLLQKAPIGLQAMVAKLPKFWCKKVWHNLRSVTKWGLLGVVPPR